MKERSLLRSGVAVLMLLLVASMSFAPAVSAAEAIGSTGGSSSESNCSACGCGGANVTVVELSGSEANKAIAEALKNEEVKELRRELIERGYTPKRSDAIAAYRVTVDSGTVMQEALMVTIPFNTHGEEVNASIVWTKENGEEKAQAIISGKAKYLEEPMNILRVNNSYQKIVANLTANEYSIDEENARVTEFIRVDSDVATIKITATKGGNVEYIVAGVDLNTNSVIYIVDLISECVTCAATLVLGTLGCGSVCIVGGSLTFGAACIACILAAGGTLAGVCLPCCCELTGDETCCNPP